MRGPDIDGLGADGDGVAAVDAGEGAGASAVGFDVRDAEGVFCWWGGGVRKCDGGFGGVMVRGGDWGVGC